MSRDVMRKRAVVKQIIYDPYRGKARPMMTSDPEGDTTWLADQILGQSLCCLHTGLTSSPSDGWCGECQSRYQAVYGLCGGSLMCLVPSHDTTLRFDSPDLIPMHRSWINFQRAAENSVWHNPTHQWRKGDGVASNMLYGVDVAPLWSLFVSMFSNHLNQLVPKPKSINVLIHKKQISQQFS